MLLESCDPYCFHYFVAPHPVGYWESPCQFLLVQYCEFNITDPSTEIATGPIGPILWVIQFFVAIHAGR